MIEKKQINLSKEPVEKNRAFMEALFKLNIPSSCFWFDKLNGSSFARKVDPDMTLEKYLANLNEGALVILQIGIDPHYIRFGASVELEDGIESFAWYECPLTKFNYRKINKLFKEVYGRSI